MRFKTQLRRFFGTNLPFEARLRLLFGVLWLVLVVAIALSVFFLLPAQMEARLESNLVKDANRLADFYNSGSVGTAPGAGGVEISLYTEDGQGLEAWGVRPKPIAPAFLVQITAEAKSFRFDGQIVAAARAPLGGLIVVITQELGPFQAVLNQTRMALVVVLAIMFVIGGLGVGYVARYATRPLREAADSVSSRQGWDTSPVPYRGPADELGRIVTEFNHLLGEIDQVHEREKVFLAEISHELRTPLTGLYGHLERLVRHYPEEAGMAGAMRSARHLKRLVEDLLLLEHGDLERRLDLRIVNLAEPLRSVAQDFPGLGLELSSGPIEVLGDPDRIQQLVRNITQNAIRATGSPKLVTIRLGRQDQEALIEIEDCGPGIEPELQAKIFDRFVHASKDGHGLGLAIAKQIADAHHGQINFTSVPGQTVFRITLPLLEMDSEDDEESRTQAGHE